MPRFSPPGNLADLTRPEHLQAWSDAVSALVDAHIPAGNQLFNQVTHPRPDLHPRRIPWLAIPQTVADHKTVEATRAQVDAPVNRRDAIDGQNEYCEWFTARDGTGKVVSVDFTTELPDYWRFLGSHLTPAQIGDIYRQLYPSATDADLFTGGNYNPFNPWNTTRGAMHLIGQINTLNPDALGVIAGGVPWRFDSAGHVVDFQDCGQGQFHADPTIVANINRMAREGRALAVADPIGVYIVDIDTSGWETPDGSDPRSLIALSRGTPPMHARIAPPAGAPWALGDVRIAGEPIRWGSQIAERMFVGITMAVGPPGEFHFTTGEICVGAAAAPAAVAALRERKRNA
ncbi:MAG TPA: hypothetical protein VJZ76_08570 [Thermoanaerobaculia bacterium]|nr:hypothetical protein [Thermoanaerobaculia bacterium]